MLYVLYLHILTAHQQPSPHNKETNTQPKPSHSCQPSQRYVSAQHLKPSCSSDTHHRVHRPVQRAAMGPAVKLVLLAMLAGLCCHGASLLGAGEPAGQSWGCVEGLGEPWMDPRAYGLAAASFALRKCV